MRRFPIRLRMQGAIAAVLLLFALVGLTGLLGGRHLAELNTAFMQHSLVAARNVGHIRHALGEVRRQEKDMVIHYEDGLAVLKAREAWLQQIARVKLGFKSQLEGEPDADNPIAEASLKELEAYVVASTRVLDQIQNGAYDTAIAADKMLARAKQHIQRVEQQVDAIEKIVDARAQATQASFEASMQLTLGLFVGVLGVVVVVVVPLTLLNSHAIITPMQQARDLAMAIAEGDLSRSVQADGQDEASDLLRALAHMQAALGGLVGEVRQASENIHTASNEVASGNTDLSGRTEQAAREIKTLIGASVDKVDAGTRLVKDAGSTMADIVTSVQRVADIIREISSATQQQSTGIGQVNGAVSTLDQMTQQNAALVEESAAAAESLKDQAGRLNTVVARFQTQTQS